MAYAWFVCPYTLVRSDAVFHLRHCAMNNFTAQIKAEGGTWSETEVLGNAALVKVRASDTLLSLINAETGFLRITNHYVLSDSLSDMGAAVRNGIQNKLLELGYTQAEINAALGTTLAEWRSKTFLDLLRFIATRRITPRWDSVLGQIIFDGITQTPKSVNLVDQEVI